MILNPNYGDTPYIKRGFQVDPKRLFASDEGIALKKLGTLVPGYGILEAGTLVATIFSSTNRQGQFVPYSVLEPSAGLSFIAGAYLLADGGATDTTVPVTMEASYRFAVGDNIAGVDSNGNPVDIGAITSIDRTTFSHYATIGFAQTDLSTLATARGAMIFIKTTEDTPWTFALAMLGEGVDTGIGDEAVGGQGAIFYSNFMVYRGLLPNVDAGAITNLGAVQVGQHLIFK